MLSELSCASVVELAAGTKAQSTLKLGDAKIRLAPSLPGSRRTDRSKIWHVFEQIRTPTGKSEITTIRATGSLVMTPQARIAGFGVSFPQCELSIGPCQTAFQDLLGTVLLSAEVLFRGEINIPSARGMLSLVSTACENLSYKRYV